jgi:hypothetical protein
MKDYEQEDDERKRITQEARRLLALTELPRRLDPGGV